MLEKELIPVIDRVCEKLGRDSKAARLFMNCYPNTLSTTTKISGEDVFVFTGDIPAMWLRDSSAQVRHYIPLVAENQSILKLIVGLSKRQADCILKDAYANAFNEKPDFNCYRADLRSRSRGSGRESMKSILSAIRSSLLHLSIRRQDVLTIWMKTL